MKLFIDDERFPPNDGTEWEIARNFEEVQRFFFDGKYPTHISFDHDLGDAEPNGLYIAKWICSFDMDFDVLPPNFSWYTHSQNPVGKKNIDMYLKQYVSITEKFKSIPRANRQTEKDLAWLQACFDISSMATCARRATGCILVDANNHVLAASFNGVPTNTAHCTDVPCAGVAMASGTGLNSCEAIHAEENALQLCSDISRVSTVYCTTSPCLDRCLRKLINTGATRVVFANEYPDPKMLGKQKWERSRAGREWVHQLMYDRVWLPNTESNKLPQGLYYVRDKDKKWEGITRKISGKTFETDNEILYQKIRTETYDRRISV